LIYFVNEKIINLATQEVPVAAGYPPPATRTGGWRSV